MDKNTFSIVNNSYNLYTLNKDEIYLRSFIINSCILIESMIDNIYDKIIPIPYQFRYHFIEESTNDSPRIKISTKLNHLLSDGTKDRISRVKKDVFSIGDEDGALKNSIEQISSSFLKMLSIINDSKYGSAKDRYTKFLDSLTDVC